MVFSTVKYTLLTIFLLVGASPIASVAAFVVPSNSAVRSYSDTHILFGWGPDPIWESAVISSSVSANQAGKCTSVTVDVPVETAQAYTIPGQYVQVRMDEGKPTILAIASPPDIESGKFGFLVKKTGDNSWLTDNTGDIEISQVLGNGFPVKEELDSVKFDFPCQNVLLFAAGSGISPIKASIESGELQTSKEGGRTGRLYYGAQSEEDLCYVEKFSEWESMGVQVVPVLSRPSESWKGRTGYVQDALVEDGVPVPRNSGALLCGMKGMAEAVTEILTRAGVYEERVLTNF